jgi:hypothetical protein
MDSQTSPSSSRPKRPDGITIIAGLVVISGVTFTLQGLFLSLFYIRFPYTGLFLISDYIGDGIFYLVLGIFLLLIGWGLWEGKRWAWIIYVILAVLDVLLSLITFNIYLLFLMAFILWYMFKPHVQRYFGMETEPTSSYTPSPSPTKNLYAGKSPEDLKSELRKLEENLQWLESQKEKGIIADEIYTQLKTEYTQKIEEIKKHLSH